MRASVPMILAVAAAVAAAGCFFGDDDGGDGPLERPIAGCDPDPLPSTGDPYQDCVDRINQLRSECQNLPPLERWYEGEACADQHAAYDADLQEPHAGIRAGICEPAGSGSQNECHGWQSIEAALDFCFQGMWDEGPGEPFEDHGHYINMSSTSATKVACGFDASDPSDVWVVQNFQ